MAKRTKIETILTIVLISIPVIYSIVQVEIRAVEPGPTMSTVLAFIVMIPCLYLLAKVMWRGRSEEHVGPIETHWHFPTTNKPNPFLERLDPSKNKDLK